MRKKVTKNFTEIKLLRQFPLKIILNPRFLVLFASWWLTFFLMLLFTARKNLLFRQQSMGRSMRLCNGGAKYLWNAVRRKQNHKSWKQYFGVVNKKLDKLWTLNRLGTLKSQIIVNTFVILWCKSVSFEPLFWEESNQTN